MAPKPLSETASAVWSELLAGRDMTARIRSLDATILEYSDSLDASDWSEDLAALGFVFTDDNSDSLCKSLASAFSTVVKEATSDKNRAARVSYIAATGEVAVAFRKTTPRERKSS